MICVHVHAAVAASTAAATTASSTTSTSVSCTTATTLPPRPKKPPPPRWDRCKRNPWRIDILLKQYVFDMLKHAVLMRRYTVAWQSNRRLTQTAWMARYRQERPAPLLLTSSEPQPSAPPPSLPPPSLPPPSSFEQLTELLKSCTISRTAATAAAPAALTVGCIHLPEPWRHASLCTFAPTVGTTASRGGGDGRGGATYYGSPLIWATTAPPPPPPPPVFIPTLDRASQFGRLLERVLGGYSGHIYAVLNNCYDAEGQLQVQRVEGYAELMSLHPMLQLWLLPAEFVGLAPVRSEIMRLTAGRGPVIIMDDDVERFLMTTSGSQRTGWHSASISFASVVERMVAASVAKPEAKMVGINHWYHHAASVLHTKAVTSGRQHLSFHPALLNLPPSFNMVTQWHSIEDDETVWRIHERWGDESILKLRYLLVKADVGMKEGGLQNKGLKRAMQAQMAEAHEALEADPTAWEWRRKFPKNKGRLSAPRARLIVDQTRVQGDPIACLIQRCVKR